MTTQKMYIYLISLLLSEFFCLFFHFNIAAMELKWNFNRWIDFNGKSIIDRHFETKNSASSAPFIHSVEAF